MSNSGTLVIGLGDVGARVKQRTVLRWKQITAYNKQSAPFSSISVSLMPNSEADHVMIDADVSRARRMFGDPLPSYINVWADEAALKAAPKGMLTRVQARLLWFASVARGSTSPLISLWTRQTRALTSAGSLAIFLIADLNETFASAVIADAVYLSRAIAAQEHLPVTLWAFTILPKLDASYSVRMGGYAALRELSRLTNTSDNVLGYPFVYRTGNHEPVTQGRLREKPFDLWYCFEGAQAEAELSALVSAFLYEQSFSEAATFAINLSVNTRKPDPLGVYVSAGNARSLVLPVQEFTSYATAQNRRTILEWLLTPPAPLKVTEAVETFLDANPSIRGRRMVNGLIEIKQNVAMRTQEARLDEWLLDNQTLAQEAFSEANHPLRASGMAFDISRQETLMTLRRVIDRVGRPVSPGNPPIPSTYDLLVMAAADRHNREFEAHLIHTFNELLNRSSGEGSHFAFARALINNLSTEFASLGAALDSMRQQQSGLEKEMKRHYDAFDKSAKALEGMYVKFGKLDRLRQAHKLRTAQITAQSEASAYLTARRLYSLIDAANRVIQFQITVLTNLDHSLTAWDTAFRSGLIAVQTIGRSLPDVPTLQWVVPSLDNPWLQEQDRMAVARSSHNLWIEQITWQVASNGITLVTPHANAHPDDLQPMWSLLDEVYIDFHRGTTLLSFFRESPPAKWLPYLAEAEQASLRVHPSIDSMALWRGRLYAPTSDFAEQRKIPETIIRDLNQAHGRDAANRSVIDIKLHDETDRLIYACSIDNIELQKETVIYGNLAAYADKHGGALESFHVLSADREAVRLGILVGHPLSPHTVALLYDIERMRCFWVAYCLNLLGEMRQANGSLAILFAVPEHRALLLTYPCQTRAQVWRSTIAAFVAGHEIQGSPPFYAPTHEAWFSDTNILAALIEKVWDAISTDIDAYVDGHAQREAWLARGRDVITPQSVREQIEQSIIHHAMLDDFIEDVERGQAVFAQDQDQDAAVLVDLYDVGIALLKEQQRAIEDQILAWIARLPGGTLSHR